MAAAQPVSKFSCHHKVGMGSEKKEEAGSTQEQTDLAPGGIRISLKSHLLELESLR